nr:helix-turn-helix domain-containing protein [Jiella sp. LLJ827]
MVWGVEAIAKLIGRTHAATYHMCANGELPARRIGRRWVAKREALERFFEDTAA